MEGMSGWGGYKPKPKENIFQQYVVDPLPSQILTKYRFMLL